MVREEVPFACVIETRSERVGCDESRRGSVLVATTKGSLVLSAHHPLEIVDKP